MIETRINITYSSNSPKNESLFENLMLHLRFLDIATIADGRTSAWQGAQIQGINIFLERASDLEKAVQAIKDFFVSRLQSLQLCIWQSQGKVVKVAIRGSVNYNESHLPHSYFEYFIE